MERSFAGGGQLCMKVCYSNCGLLSTYGIPNILQIRISHSHFRFALILKCFLWIMCQIWFSFTIWNQVFKNWKLQKKLYDCDRTWTCNSWVRCPLPYPLGHTTWYELSCNLKISFYVMVWWNESKNILPSPQQMHECVL